MNNDGFKITLERTPEGYIDSPTPAWKRSALAFHRFIEKCKNTFRLVRHGELRKPLKSRACPRQWLSKFSTFLFTSHVASCPMMMKAVLKYPRKDDLNNGLFQDRENVRVFLPLLRDLFPDDHISEDDFLFTCHHHMVQMYPWLLSGRFARR